MKRKMEEIMMKHELKKKTKNPAEFTMPECTFCSTTCGSCIYYEQYGFGKAYCNYHKRDTSSSNVSCEYYE